MVHATIELSKDMVGPFHMQQISSSVYGSLMAKVSNGVLVKTRIVEAKFEPSEINPRFFIHVRVAANPTELNLADIAFAKRVCEGIKTILQTSGSLSDTPYISLEMCELKNYYELPLA